MTPEMRRDLDTLGAGLPTIIVGPATAEGWAAFGRIERAIDALTAERDFLLARAGQAGAVRFTPDRWTGTSSNAMVRAAFGGPSPEPSEYPLDAADLRACELTYERAPRHLRSVMGPILDDYRAALGAEAETA